MLFRSKGVDVLIDNIGGPALQRNLESMNVLGRIVSVGRLAANSGPVDMDLLALKRVKVIGVTSYHRAPSAPDFLTLHEAGLTDYDYSGWFGIVAHGNTPAALVQALNQGITQVINQPETQAAMLKNGADPLTGTPEQFRSTILNALGRTEAVLKATGLKLSE